MGHRLRAPGTGPRGAARPGRRSTGFTADMRLVAAGAPARLGARRARDGGLLRRPAGARGPRLGAGAPCPARPDAHHRHRPGRAGDPRPDASQVPPVHHQGGAAGGPGRGGGRRDGSSEFYAIHTDAMRRAGHLAPDESARTATCGTRSRPAAWRACCSRRPSEHRRGRRDPVPGGVRPARRRTCTAARPPRAAGCAPTTCSSGRRSDAAGRPGYTEYDLWGLPREGIEQFKSGFGGAEIDYVGAWDLVTDTARPARAAGR